MTETKIGGGSQDRIFEVTVLLLCCLSNFYDRLHSDSSSDEHVMRPIGVFYDGENSLILSKFFFFGV